MLCSAEGDPPISIFHLPPYCGYSLTTSQQDLVMMVPYDACYITEEVPAALALYSGQWSLISSFAYLPSNLSEWQLCSALAVVGNPTEALLPSAAAHTCSTASPPWTLTVLLPLRHDGADTSTRKGYTETNSHRYSTLTDSTVNILKWLVFIIPYF